VPAHLKDKFNAEKNDLTPEVLKNLEWLGINTLVPIGGDDTLSYGVRLHKEGFKVIGIPKTMDNDVPGTDYCIGFSTCVTRTIQLVNSLRTSAGSHERFMILEVFGRYAGFTAMLADDGGCGEPVRDSGIQIRHREIGRTFGARPEEEPEPVFDRAGLRRCDV